MTDCSVVLPLIHAELRDIGEAAGEMALFVYGARADDPRVLESAVRQKFFDVYVDDRDRIRHLLDEMIGHARRFIQEREG